MTQDVEKPRIANATTEPKAQGEIEITPEMVEAGAEVLWRHPMLDIPPGFAETLVREILKCALPASHETDGETEPHRQQP
jgi:hypothetical protein